MILKKKIRKIKWENILTIVMIVIDIAAIAHHIELNGFYLELILEVVMYGLMTSALWVGVYSIRKGI